MLNDFVNKFDTRGEFGILDTGTKEQGETFLTYPKMIERFKMLNFTRKKNLTLPMIKPVIDREFYIRVETPITVSKVAPKKGEEPAKVMEVTDLETGETHIMIANAVIDRALHDDYENDSYVGKCFAMTKHAIKGSAKFNPYSIAEIELEKTE